MWFLTSDQHDLMNECLQEGRYDEAICFINELLVKDPSNEELLLTIADIQYQQGEIDKASKAVDFLNSTTNHKDPMGLYVKGVLEMEKNHRKEARNYLLKAMECLERDNYEIMRCYALAEYRYGNREKGVYHLERAHDLNPYDMETIFNILEIYLLERKFHKAEELIQFFYDHQNELETYDKDIASYTTKIKIFSDYIATYHYKRKRITDMETSS